AMTVLEQVGLADWADHRPAELSGGQRQRVTLARALVNEPAIVWADEPTGNLDAATSADVLALIQRLNQERGQTFVIVTHDPQVSATCDRIVTMTDGQILSDIQALQ
ncbi:MAG: ATP-binding cassette domain-containing protein, partial [Caldilineae bacterium]